MNPKYHQKPHIMAWDKVFTGDLESFRLSLAKGETVNEARSASKEKKPIKPIPYKRKLDNIWGDPSNVWHGDK